jgi:hypothetical protein
VCSTRVAARSARRRGSSTASLLAAVDGREDDARDALRRALAGEPALREEAERDPDLSGLL